MRKGKFLSGILCTALMLTSLAGCNWTTGTTTSAKAEDIESIVEEMGKQDRYEGQIRVSFNADSDSEVDKYGEYLMQWRDADVEDTLDDMFQSMDYEYTKGTVAKMNMEVDDEDFALDVKVGDLSYDVISVGDELYVGSGLVEELLIEDGSSFDYKYLLTSKEEGGYTDVNDFLGGNPAEKPSFLGDKDVVIVKETSKSDKDSVTKYTLTRSDSSIKELWDDIGLSDEKALKNVKSAQTCVYEVREDSYTVANHYVIDGVELISETVMTPGSVTVKAPDTDNVFDIRDGGSLYDPDIDIGGDDEIDEGEGGGEYVTDYPADGGSSWGTPSGTTELDWRTYHIDSDGSYADMSAKFGQTYPSKVTQNIELISSSYTKSDVVDYLTNAGNNIGRATGMEVTGIDSDDLFLSLESYGEDTSEEYMISAYDDGFGDWSQWATYRYVIFDTPYNAVNWDYIAGAIAMYTNIVISASDLAVIGQTCADGPSTSFAIYMEDGTGNEIRVSVVDSDTATPMWTVTCTAIVQH